MSNRTAEVQRGKTLGWRVPTPKEMMVTVMFPDAPLEQPPLPFFDANPPTLTDGVSDFIDEHAASFAKVSDGQLTLFGQAFFNPEDRQAMYQARLTLLYEEKKRGNMSDAQFAAQLEHLNVGWDKPKDWDIVNEIGQGEESLAHARRASEEYLAGRGRQAEQSYDQAVATPFGNLRAHKQEFSLHAYQDMDETRDAIEESVDALKATRYQSLRLSRKMYEMKMPIGGKIQALKEQINDWEQAVPTPTRKAIAFMGRVGVSGLEMAALAGCALQGEPTLTHAPTATHTPSSTPTATNVPGFETGQMFSFTPEGRAFYDALQVHQVSINDCSPTKIGALVEQNKLSLDQAAKLTAVTTEALKNTPEPDHLTSMVCDVKGNTISWYLTSDRDGNGNGNIDDDVFIPSQSGVFLPGVLVDNVPTIMIPNSNSLPNTLRVNAPHWSAKGGEIPTEIRPLVKVGEESLRSALQVKGITDSVLIDTGFYGSGDTFRIGSGATNLDRTVAFFPRFDDNQDGLAWRPDLQIVNRPWHYERVRIPKGVDGKIRVVLDESSDVPQFVVVTPDQSRMLGWFDPTTGTWRTPEGLELTKDTVPTNTPTPSSTPTPTKTFTPTPTMTSTITPTPSKTPTVTMTPSPTREPFIVRPDLEAVVPDTWKKCASKTSESADYLMWQAYNAYGQDRIFKEAAAYKASGKYKKPSLAADISRGSSAGGLAFGYSAYAEDALYIGSRPCLLSGSSFGYAKGVNISVEVDFYVPIDRLDRPFISIRKFTYPEGRFGTFFGIQDFLEESLLLDGRPYLKAQTGQKPAEGQVFRVGRATSMDEVDWYKNGKVPKGVVEISPDADGYYRAMGKDLLEILGLATRQEAQDILGQPNAQFLYSDDQLNKLLEMINKRPITILKELILKKR